DPLVQLVQLVHLLTGQLQAATHIRILVEGSETAGDPRLIGRLCWDLARLVGRLRRNLTRLCVTARRGGLRPKEQSRDTAHEEQEREPGVETHKSSPVDAKTDVL